MEHTITPAALDTDTVLDWLREHPGVFKDHPELLDVLEFEHDAGATSLIERQVERLREENLNLKTRLQHLIAIAGENQRLVQRLHRLTLEVMATADLEQFIEDVATRLKADFHAEVVILHPGPGGPDPGTAEYVRHLPSPVPEWLQKLAQAGRPVCGRLTRAKLKTVFGETAGDVASCALVPLEDGGLLSIGSADPQRFFADMGTLFLELLGATVDFRLGQLSESRRKRA